MKQLPTKSFVSPLVAGRVTGCGRAGRVTEGPPPSPCLPPLSHCRAGCWMWLRWQRETRSLSVIIPPRPPFSPVAGRMTGRADKQGRYPPHPRLPSPFPHLTRCGAGEWMWSCWPRETRSLSSPPTLLPPPSHPFPLQF